MRHFVLAGLAIGSLSMTACMDEREYADPAVFDQQFDGSVTPTGNMKLQNAFLRGDIGPVTGIDGPAVVDGNDDPSFGTMINMTSQTRTGSGLVILQLDRSLQ